MNDEVTVLYVAGSNRTGSTVVANILGQLDGYFAVGELWNIWRRGIVEGRRCGCGQRVDSCPEWDRILRQAFGRRLDRREAQRLDTLTRERLVFPITPHRPDQPFLTRRILTRRIRAVRNARRNPSLDDEYRDTLVALYRAVHDVTGCRVIVDSSKNVVYAALLATLPGVRLHILHLLRDPRAAAFSNMRARALPDFGDDRLMPRERPYVTARRWTLEHALCGLLLPGHVASFTRLRYEDFMARPEQAIAGVVAATGVPAALPFTADRTVRLAATHSVSGNPARFRLGEVTLRSDDEWRRAMRLPDRAVVTALTWPLLLQHHYPLLAGRPERERDVA